MYTLKKKKSPTLLSFFLDKPLHNKSEADTMEASWCCGIPPQGVWLEIEWNMPWHYPASTAWSQLHSEPQCGAWQHCSCPCSYHLVPFFCTKTLYTTAASFPPWAHSALSALAASPCLCRLWLYWEFLLGIPPLGILPPDFKGKRIIMPFINIGFSVMTFRPLSRQAGKQAHVYH